MYTLVEYYRHKDVAVKYKFCDMVTGQEIILDRDNAIKLVRNREVIRARIQLRGNNVAIVPYSKLRTNGKTYIEGIEYTVIKVESNLHSKV